MHLVLVPTWFSNWIVLLVRLQVGFGTEFVSRGPPVAGIILIVCIEGADVEDHGFTRFDIHSRVAIPAITVHETWLDAAPLFLEWKEKTRNDLFESAVRYYIEFRPFNSTLAWSVKAVRCRLNTAPQDLSQCSTSCEIRE